MKRIFLILTMLTLVLPVLPRTASAEVSIDFFYDNLAGGNWIEVDGYGYCWQPDVAVNDPSWRPYADGYWAYTDAGWTWVSYEDFGWATYHYGRWARLADYGWVWVPGADLEWGPAWVSWRTGGDYIGWAPLPPAGPEIVYEGRPIGGTVDVEFDIGPEYYNFCDVRYIGEPVLRQRIVDVRQNVTYINQTVNVTNITVQNNTVYNYGPDINVINQRSSRPIQRLRLERQQNVDVASAARSGGITKVQGNSLVVAAPMKIAKPAHAVAPPRVKAKVAQPKIEKGWAGVNPSEQAHLKEKIKTEDRSKIPPPTGAGAAATGQAAAGAPTVAPEFGKHKGKREPFGAPAPASRSAAGAESAVASPAPEHGEHKGKRGEEFGHPAAGKPAVAAEGAVTPPLSEHGQQKGRHAEQLGSTPPAANPALERGHRHEERGNIGPTPGGAGPQGENINEARGMHRHVQPGAAGEGMQNQAVPPAEARGGGQRGEGAHVAPPTGAPAGAATAAPGGQGKHEHKGKPEKGSPSPGPR